MDPSNRLLAGSPSSSEAVASTQNTPETKLTAFSPEELRSGYQAGKSGVARPNVPPTFSLNVYPTSASNSNAGNAAVGPVSDPFVGPSNVTSAGTRSSGMSNLSAAATAFTPAGRQHLTLPSAAFKYRDETSDSRATTPRANATNSNTAATASSSTVGVNQPTSIDASAFPKFGTFTTDHDISRYLMVSQVAMRTKVPELQMVFNKGEFVSLKHLGANELTLSGTVYVSFSDIRDALSAYSKVQSVRSDWKVTCIGTERYFKTEHPTMVIPPLVYEGQVSIAADYGGPDSLFSASSIGTIVKEMLENYGEVMAMETTAVATQSATYRAEFFDSNSVNIALSALQGFRIAGCLLTIRPYKEGKNVFIPLPNVSQGPRIVGQDDTGLESSLQRMTLGAPQPLMYGRDLWASPLVSPYFPVHQSATTSFSNHRELNGTHMPSPLNLQKSAYNLPGSSETSPYSPYLGGYMDYDLQSPLWSPYTPGAIGQERGVSMLNPYSGVHPYQQRSPNKYLTRSPHDYSSGHHNVVGIERIRQGLDVRTTIMLRNIPNKIDQIMLKEIVDESSKGKYDFMYLRIDFANNCNVGYAFINFEDPYYIIDFMNARAGQRWNRFNSDKVAEVSYATIQGRDCLVQKFRNSSVMLEHPSFRPKIFHTGTDSPAGTEDSFPGPDNPSKMRRSVENAEHVGLFAPRAGQNFRDEQRRRRSQYDRGTRYAEMEENYEANRPEFRGQLGQYYPAQASAAPLRYHRSSPFLPQIFEGY